MMSESKCAVEDSVLQIPEEFSFPFQPYQIQIDFMKSLYAALDNRKLGVFESPTGTGKSLSLLCGSLTWLEQREVQRLRDLKSVVTSFNLEREEKLAKDAENWITAQYAFLQKKEKVFKATRELQFMENMIENRRKCLEGRKQLKTTPLYYSKENKTGKDAKEDFTVDPIDELTNLLLDDDFAPESVSDSECGDDEDVEEKEPEFHPLKVIFASRTHSQLSQFVNELKKTQFAAKVTTASLGSRQTLCVNADVTRLKSLSLINDRCLDLQKNSKGKKTKDTKKQKTCSGCPYFNQTGIDHLKNQILCDPMDIEELVKVGRKTKACPYYASRKASKEAQLVLLPYNTILHSSTRSGIGLRTENSAIILDEAHNIIESMSNMYSNQVTLPQVQETLTGLKTYMNRYMSRFNPKNLLKMKQIAHILKLFVAFLGSGESSRVFYIQEFIAVCGMEKLDLYELFKYMTKSKLVFKLKGYLQLQDKQRQLEAATSSNPNPNSDVEPGKQGASPGQAALNFFEFLKSITLSCASGRIIHDGQLLKFLLLDTADLFSDIVKSARSIILAGGTMKPYEDVHDQLFYESKERIVNFSCSHVIPDENLICLALSHGASVSFDFTFKSRKSPQLLQDLSGTVLNVSRVVPGGLVIFLPSYDYEETFHSHMKQSGMLEKIEAKKKIFREPKQSSCDKVLSDYSRQIRLNPGGAILLAVVGGKLSEGINFGNDLGRCVIVVGLPYPNITSVEIKQKVQFVSDKFGPEKGKQLLTNACFKSVNQSIGRVIRHANDYAAIILLDARFLSNDSEAQLPDWIRKKYERTVLVQNNDVDAAMRLLNRIMGREGMFDQFRRTRRYEKPFQTRRRLNYEKCKAIYNEDMARKIQFVMRKNRTNPYPGCF